jgi:hypothetical protein
MRSERLACLEGGVGLRRRARNRTGHSSDQQRGRAATIFTLAMLPETAVS